MQIIEYKFWKEVKQKHLIRLSNLVFQISHCR